MDRKYQSSLVTDLENIVQRNLGNLSLLEEIQYELYNYRRTQVATNLLQYVDNLINEIETQKRLKKSPENKDTKDLIQIVENYKDQVTTLQQKKEP